ncbi:protein-L-isoaspartate(D-aspartate) O-methyltransferase [Blastochloris viridis]|uniref:Protein-L-isoaspartate O-methyltransferase n=1 Tax=Blastochloris viridis TaxID=1079 RepID=A0A0H5BQE0_BLAVI|nr:protein-L-isoaspartate(D-aspartate) O-methyltransferase [Blastochloris viridis]ALK09338.1 Protein-L-isoaspartate O-methyltransferase [Blastochloris viridis]BAS00784.1 protein-L-isoaspartate O-methyltransferase [Blastochloris viridis]CUU42001.1 Protein-L-isoaspartate O-methyltransferase [Blastochloris viridis]
MGALTPKRDESIGRMQFLLGLRRRGIRDTNVLRALETVPRELFVDPADRDVAWEDRALPIACGQTISQPSLVAAMTDALDVHRHHTVLEIGTGSGYQAAILGKLAGRVVTVERFRTLAELAESRLRRLELTNVEVHLADGSLGWPAAAPYDRIILTAAAPQIPPAVFDQLTVGGIMIAPVGPDGEVQELMRITRTETGRDERSLLPVRFVPLLPGVARSM